MDRKRAMQVSIEMQERGFMLHGERVAFIRDKDDDKLKRTEDGMRMTQGGIVLPDTAITVRPIRGTIVFIGNAVDMEDPKYKDLEIGLRLSFIKYDLAQQEYTCLDGEKVKIDIIHVTDVYFTWPGVDQ